MEWPCRFLQVLLGEVLNVEVERSFTIPFKNEGFWLNLCSIAGHSHYGVRTRACVCVCVCVYVVISRIACPLFHGSLHTIKNPVCGGGVSQETERERERERERNREKQRETQRERERERERERGRPDWNPNAWCLIRKLISEYGPFFRHNSALQVQMLSRLCITMPSSWQQAHAMEIYILLFPLQMWRMDYESCCMFTQRCVIIHNGWKIDLQCIVGIGFKAPHYWSASCLKLL